MKRFVVLSIALFVVLGMTGLIMQILGVGKEKRPLPNIQVQSLGSEMVVLSELPKKARVLHIFDTNHHELDLLSRALNSASYKDIDYRFLAVQTSPEATHSLIEEAGIPKNLVYLDPNAEVANALLYASLPNTLFLNPEDVLVKNRSSIVRPEFLESDLKSLLN